MIIIKELPKRPIDPIFKMICDTVCVRRIDKTADINDNRWAETIDTKVSSVTFFLFFRNYQFYLP